MDALMQTLSQQYGQDGILTIPTEKLAELLTSHTPNKKTRQKRPARDPNRPKRPQSAFFLWSADNRDRVRQNWMTTYPASGITDPKDVTLGNISKELGIMWKELDEDAKASYVEAAAFERDRYAAEKATYEDENGVPPTRLRASKFNTDGALPDTPDGWTGPFDGYLEKSPKDPNTGKTISRSFQTFEEAVEMVSHLGSGGITRTPTGYKIRVATSVSINDASRAKSEISWIIGGEGQSNDVSSDETEYQADSDNE